MSEASDDAADARLYRLTHMVLEGAVDLLGADAASLTARHAGELSTIAATDRRVLSVDEVQYATRSGPCIDALDPRAGPVVVADVDVDGGRWPEFREAAREAGIRASMSTHIPNGSNGLDASMNVYLRRPFAPGERESRIAEAVAEQLAAAIESVEAERAAQRLAAQMVDAMRSRAVIEQAKGIVMAARGVTADEAFTYLVARSMDGNKKLRDLAVELVEKASRRR